MIAVDTTNLVWWRHGGADSPGHVLTTCGRWTLCGRRVTLSNGRVRRGGSPEPCRSCACAGAGSPQAAVLRGHPVNPACPAVRFVRGTKVVHPRFGPGTVVRLHDDHGDPDRASVTVSFPRLGFGPKRLPLYGTEMQIVGRVPEVFP